jgi:hypothetical protein
LDLGIWGLPMGLLGASNAIPPFFVKKNSTVAWKKKFFEF